MDNPAAPTPSTPPQLELSPTESPNRRWLLWLASGLVMLIIGIAIGVFSAKFLSRSQGQPQSSQPTSSPTPLPSEISAQGDNPTTDWKIYTDEEFGFTFQYSSSGKIEESSNHGAKIISYIGPYTPTQQVLYYKISLQKSPFVEPSRSSKDIFVAGIIAKRWDDIDTSEGNSILIILNTGKGFLRFEYFIRGGGWDTQLDQILSTFHFLK